MAQYGAYGTIRYSPDVGAVENKIKTIRDMKESEREELHSASRRLPFTCHDIQLRA